MILNRNQFFSKLKKQLGIIPEQNAKRACYKAANVVKNDAVKSIMTGAKSGELVRKYNPSRTHRQSAAGQPPASDTGFLVSQISADVEKQVTSIVGIVRSSAPYAAHLEFGTQQMPARPYLQPALDKNADKIRQIFIKEGIIS
jgi:HK97 gp10 family phage protein